MCDSVASTRSLDVSVVGQKLFQPRHADSGDPVLCRDKRSAYISLTCKSCKDKRKRVYELTCSRARPESVTVSIHAACQIHGSGGCLALVGASCLHAQQSKPTEYQVKAAYLYISAGSLMAA